MITTDPINVTELPIHTRKEAVYGMTYDALNGRIPGFTTGVKLDQPSSGYMVANTKAFSACVNVNDPERFAKARKAVNDLFTIIGQSTGLFIGGWMEGDNLLIELSYNVQDRIDAESLGRKGDQYSIWDVVAGEEIVL
jgi:hypothetical protein